MLEQRGLHGGLKPGVAPAHDDEVVPFLQARKAGHRNPRAAAEGI